MALLYFLVRIVLTIAWVLLGLLTELLLFPALSRARRRSVVAAWSRGLLCVCGVRVQVVGTPHRDTAVLWAANHVSWVDIFVLNSVRTTSFVAKSDIRRWPVIGLLVAWAGTLFIDRGHRQAVRQATEQMGQCLAQGDAVGLFPEGTTSDGSDVLPFHAGLFQAAVQSGVPVQPVALRLLRNGQFAADLAFVGDQTLVANLWFLLGARRVSVRCEFLPALSPDSLPDRGRLAQQAHRAVRRALLNDSPRNPVE